MGFFGIPLAFPQMPAAIAYKPHSRFMPVICHLSSLPALAANTRQVEHWFHTVQSPQVHVYVAWQADVYS